MPLEEGAVSNTENVLEIPPFFSQAVDIQLHKFRAAHARIVTPGQAEAEMRANFAAAADAMTVLREMAHDKHYQESSPVECEILRGILLALEVMFAGLSTRYLLP